MQVNVIIGATPELTGLALALTNLINGTQSVNLLERAASSVQKLAEGCTKNDEPTKDEVDEPAKEEKPKATRTRTKKEEPGVQEPPKKEEVEEEEKPAKEEKPKTEVVEVEAEEGSITIEDIRKIQRKVSLGGGIEKMKDLLATFGVESASELKESDYDVYYEKLVELV